MLLLLALLLTGIACSKVPKGVLPPEQMAQMLADFHTGEAVTEIERRTFDNESIRMVLRNSILAKHGLTPEQFDSSLMWYGRNIDLYSTVYSRVVNILDERLLDLETRAGTSDMTFGPSASGYDPFEIEGDSVDVWPQQSKLTFNPGSPAEIVQFRLLSDHTWEQGDVYTFNAKLSGSRDYFNLVLAVEYFDGSVDYLSIRSMGNGWKRYSLSTDHERKPRYIYGLVGYTPRPGEYVFLDSISLMRSRYTGNFNSLYPIHHFDRHN